MEKGKNVKTTKKVEKKVNAHKTVEKKATVKKADNKKEVKNTKNDKAVLNTKKVNVVKAKPATKEVVKAVKPVKVVKPVKAEKVNTANVKKKNEVKAAPKKEPVKRVAEKKVEPKKVEVKKETVKAVKPAAKVVKVNNNKVKVDTKKVEPKKVETKVVKEMPKQNKVVEAKKVDKKITDIKPVSKKEVISSKAKVEPKKEVAKSAKVVTPVVNVKPNNDKEKVKVKNDNKALVKVSVKNESKALLSKDKQKCVNGFSKAFAIIAKIMEIFSYVGAGFVIVAMVFVPLLSSNIDLTENSIGLKSVKEARLELVEEEGKHSIKAGDELVADLSASEADVVKEVLKNADLTKVVVYIEGACLAYGAALVFMALVLNILNKLFKNISDLDTPFSMENVNYINKAAYMLVGALAVPIVIELIFELITGIDISVNGNLVYLLVIIGLFTMGYVFEYGYKLQEKTDAKMYGELN